MAKKFFINNAEDIIPPVNDSPYRRILAVGDVHGKFNKLMSLWKKLSVTDDDLIIFLGDYIDRGEGVAEVLEWVIKQSEKKNFIFLRGNHEQMMLNAFKSDFEFLEKIRNGEKKILTNRDAVEHEAAILWVINGGEYTLAGINAFCEKNNRNLEDVLNFAENLPLSYPLEIGGRKYFFCHAGVNAEIPLDEQDEEFLLWSRDNFFKNYNGDAVIISGHSPVQAYFDFSKTQLRPIKFPSKNIVMTDTGSFLPDGKISCVDILNGQFWQSDNATGGIIFVCSGNTCRSPMAKYIMKHLLEEIDLSHLISVDSAGCDTEGGESLSPEARKELIKNHIPFDKHVSKKFTKELYEKFKVIVALDDEIFNHAAEISGGDLDKKIIRLKGPDGNKINVDDPWHTGDYSKAYSEIYSGCFILLKKLTEKIKSRR